MNYYIHISLVSCIFLATACGGGGGSGTTNPPNTNNGGSVSGRVVAFANNVNTNAFSSTLQSDGKLVIAGRSGGECAVARFNTDRTPDTTFNNTGYLFTSSNTGDCEIASIASQSDGKLLVLSSSKSVFSLARYNSNGIIDTSFANKGTYTTVYSGFNILTKGNVAISVDGGIFIYGLKDTATIAITKLRLDGTLDTSYNATGFNDYKNGNSVYGGEKVVVKDSRDVFWASIPDQYEFYIGSRISFGSDRWATLTGVIPTNNGGIYAIGISRFANSNATKYDLSIAKVKSDGTLDVSFNSSGTIVLTNYSNGTYKGVSQPDGKLVVTDGVNVIRLNNDGTLDSNFKNGSNIPSLFTQRVNNVLIQNDGKINVISEDFSYIRLSSNGVIE
jgi:uncharacterized delta-60 repeat protein